MSVNLWISRTISIWDFKQFALWNCEVDNQPLVSTVDFMALLSRDRRERIPTGLPNEEVMFENPPERPDRACTWFVTGYRPVIGVPVVFQHLFTHREGLSGTFPSISASLRSSNDQFTPRPELVENTPLKRIFKPRISIFNFLIFQLVIKYIKI